jgi:hypothetical protein
MVREGTLIATVYIGLTSNVGYCTTLDGSNSKTFWFDNTLEGFEKFWAMVLASKNRFGCDEVLVLNKPSTSGGGPGKVLPIRGKIN